MIVAWNIMGQNKGARSRYISSCLSRLDPNTVILLETRVKQKMLRKLGGFSGINSVS